MDHDHAPLPALTVRELIDRLARTEEATRHLTAATLSSDTSRQLLDYQHAILTELRHRRTTAMTGPPGSTHPARSRDAHTGREQTTTLTANGQAGKRP